MESNTMNKQVFQFLDRMPFTKKDTNSLFKELLEELLTKNINFATRVALIQHLYQKIFMPYQLDYTSLYRSIESSDWTLSFQY